MCFKSFFFTFRSNFDSFQIQIFKILLRYTQKMTFLNILIIFMFSKWVFFCLNLLILQCFNAKCKKLFFIQLSLKHLPIFMLKMSHASSKIFRLSINIFLLFLFISKKMELKKQTATFHPTVKVILGHIFIYFIFNFMFSL